MLNIQIEKTSSPKRRPGQDALGFGQYFTDHMFVMDYTLGVGWHSARIEPFPFPFAQPCSHGVPLCAREL